jgi:hypothetical protein
MCVFPPMPGGTGPRAALLAFCAPDQNSFHNLAALKVPTGGKHRRNRTAYSSMGIELRCDGRRKPFLKRDICWRV